MRRPDAKDSNSGPATDMDIAKGLLQAALQTLPTASGRQDGPSNNRHNAPNSSSSAREMQSSAASGAAFALPGESQHESPFPQKPQELSTQLEEGALEDGQKRERRHGDAAHNTYTTPRTAAKAYQAASHPTNAAAANRLSHDSSTLTSDSDDEDHTTVRSYYENVCLPVIAEVS